MSMGVQIPVQVPAFNSLDMYLERGLLNFMVILYLVPRGAATLSSTVAVPFYGLHVTQPMLTYVIPLETEGAKVWHGCCKKQWRGDPGLVYGCPGRE